LDSLKRKESESKVPDESEISKMDDEINTLNYRLLMAKRRKFEAQQRRVTLASEQNTARLIQDAVAYRINSLNYEKNCLKDQLDSMTDETMKVAVKLQRFMQINAINDAFYVWYSGPYGTINNFRLGNIALKPVEWNEINAALGQAMLAIATVAAKAGYEFKRYVLSPLGSYSKVFKVEDKRTPLALYTDGSFQLFPKRSFNAALTGFLSCVQELGEYTKAKDPPLELPYAINVQEGKIYDQVITLGADDEMWTRALKFLLTDVKLIVAWASRHCNDNFPLPEPLPVSQSPKISKKIERNERSERTADRPERGDKIVRSDVNLTNNPMAPKPSQRKIDLSKM
jgi:beclin 1